MRASSRFGAALGSSGQSSRVATAIALQSGLEPFLDIICAAGGPGGLYYALPVLTLRG